MAKMDHLSHEQIDVLNADGVSVDWKKVKKQFTLTTSRKHFNTASIGPSPLKVQETTIAPFIVLINMLLKIIRL